MLSNDLKAKHNIQVQVITIDIADDDFLDQIHFVSDHLDIGLLINSAGFALTGNFLDHAIEEESSLLNVNCGAPIILSHYFGNKMIERGKGGIINVALASAFLSMP